MLFLISIISFCNRELAALKRMLNLGARCTPPKVDREQGIVRLEVGETNNDEGRTAYLDDELKEVFETQWNDREKGKNFCPMFS